MEAARADPQAHGSRFEGLHAEATAAVGHSANTLRAVREQYREAYAAALSEWQELRDELEQVDRGRGSGRGPNPARPRLVVDAADAAAAAEAGAEDARTRALRGEVERVGAELGARQSTLARLDFAEQALERTWLFLKEGDASLVDGATAATGEDDLAMRIIEAQEAERARIAQEIHDGPAQALSNAIFQADYVERVAATDPAAGLTELRILRDLLRRELGDVRDSINQLRPPLVDALGLEGAIEDAAERLRTLAGLTITTELDAPGDRLDQQQRTVALRVTQEALQNVRKHAGATNVVVRTELARVDESWVLEIRDDGRGFDVGAVAARGRRNFGLQFMRERAELIGGRFEVRSRPDGGTVIRLAIPTGVRMGVEESI